MLTYKGKRIPIWFILLTTGIQIAIAVLLALID